MLIIIRKHCRKAYPSNRTDKCPGKLRKKLNLSCGNYGVHNKEENPQNRYTDNKSDTHYDRGNFKHPWNKMGNPFNNSIAKNEENQT